MATLFTIEGTTAQGTKAKDCFCDVYDYNSNKIGAETEKQFSARMIREFIRDVCRKSDVDDAEPDRAAIIAAADSDLDGMTVT
jgi:hypothetical protein